MVGTARRSEHILLHLPTCTYCVNIVITLWYVVSVVAANEDDHRNNGKESFGWRHRFGISARDVLRTEKKT